jgi:NAD(P)-dependent dehydrogenase (short-subunit alcohol dehydrogenase family)
MDALTTIERSSLFVVSGGARGITAHCVIALARRFGCRFLLLGRTDIDGGEPTWAAGCTDEAELQRRIVTDLSAHGERPVPLATRAALSRILARREIVATLRAVEEAGGSATYLRADVADHDSLRPALAEALTRIGASGVTGLIHGAGALSDKPIERKSADDFEAVYAVKTDGLVNLLDALADQQLRYLVLFSSAAGFYGNAGQADYALANEVLNKAAHRYARSHPATRVLSLNWGPWDGGMVTPALKAHFAARGVEMIALDAGAQALADALDRPPGDAVQLVVGDGLPSNAGPIDGELRRYRIWRLLSLEANPFLHDHVVGGQAVLPTASAVSWFANACEQLHPGMRAYRVDDIRVLKGIIFDADLADEYVLDLEEVERSLEAGQVVLDGVVWSATAGGRERQHYRARITLARRQPEILTYPRFDLQEDEHAVDGAWLYQDGTLFHGPSFRIVERVLNANQERLTVRCALPIVSDPAQGQFPIQTFNPYLADVQGQSQVIWARIFRGAASLPLRVERVETFAALPAGTPFYVSMEVREASPYALLSDVFAHDGAGQVYCRLTGCEVTISEHLNRLFRPAAPGVVPR